MSWLEILGTAVTLLLGPGGVLVVWLTVRTKQQAEPITTTEAAATEVEATLGDAKLVAMWREYATEVEDRQQESLDRLEARYQRDTERCHSEIDQLRTDLAELREEIKREREVRRKAEVDRDAAEFQSRLALAALIDIHDWLEAGQPPPPRTRPPWLNPPHLNDLGDKP